MPALCRRRSSGVARHSHPIYFFNIDFFNVRPDVRHESDLPSTIGALDGVFGADRVWIVPFERSTLQGKSIVRDFCHRFGIDLDPRRIRRQNEGLCHDALTLLHASNTYGEPFGRRPPRRNDDDGIRVAGDLLEVLAREFVLARS